MAILHSRFGRVFYGTSYPDFGGLGSVFSVHCERSLNHHFHVYRGLLLAECRDLWNPPAAERAPS